MSGIFDIEYYVPENVLTNEEIGKRCKNFNQSEFEAKVGIKERRISAPDECPSDMAVKASQKIFAKGTITHDEIDLLIIATQNPDYKLPTTACIVQDKLGLSKNCAAFDINLGCSAYPYALAIGDSFVKTGLSRCVLLIMSEAYSKVIDYRDKSVCGLFGDAAAATVVKPVKTENYILAYDFGTDGSGYDRLIVSAGGSRISISSETSKEIEDEREDIRSLNNLRMFGKDIFRFMLDVVPASVERALKNCSLKFEEIDFFIFHQANGYMLDFLFKEMKIPTEKTIVFLEKYGNTVSASLPMALKEALETKRIKRGDKVLLCGFGVGLSWATVILKWSEKEDFE